jgi:hypothetical protein
VKGFLLKFFSFTLRSTLTFILLGLSSHANLWQQWGRLDEIRDLEFDPKTGMIYVATNMGLVQFNPACNPCQFKVYNTSHRLESNDLSAIEIDANGKLWTVSTQGIIQTKENELFETQHRTFSSQNLNLVNRQAKINRKYMILGFEKGIAFWNSESKVSLATIGKLGGINLSNSPLLGIEIDNDTLFAIHRTGIHKAWIPWDSLSRGSYQGKLFNLFDPTIWTPVEFKGKTPIRSYHRNASGFTTDTTLAFELDSNRALNSEGALVQRGSEIQTIKDSNQALRSQFLKEANGTIWVSQNFDHSKKKLQETQLLKCSESSCQTINIPSLPSMYIHSLTVNMGGRPYFYGQSSLWSMDQNGWSQSFTISPTLDYSGEIVVKNIQGLQLQGNDFAWPSWAFGLQVLSASNGSVTNYDGSNTCIQSGWSSGFAPIAGLTQMNNELWLINQFSETNDYSISKRREDGEFECYGKGSSLPTGLEWQSDSILNVFTSQTIDQWSYQNRELLFLKSVQTNAIGSVKSAATDAKGRIWMISSTEIGVLCDGSKIIGLCDPNDIGTIKNASEILGITRKNIQFSFLVNDPQGDLWIGTLTHGLARLSFSKPLSASQLTWYQASQGMYSNVIKSLTFDPPRGILWIVHPDGISRLETERRDAAGNENISTLVYPNPFRYNKHQMLRLRGLEPDAEVRLLHPDGTVLKAWPKSAVRSGYFEVNVVEDIGLLQPGVYRITVQTKKKTERHNWIVIR